MFDVIVVGAGIEGSAAAYNLAKNGQTTLLLEQFSIPHSRGSSHGQSRIIRKAYGKKDYYTQMMKEAYVLWEELEKESDTTLYKKCGCLAVCPDGKGFVSETIASLHKHNLPYESFTSAELSQKFPMMSYPPNYSGVLDTSGGIIKSDKALEVFQRLFKHYGGVLHDREPLLSLSPGSVITVRTSKTEYQTKHVVLTVGPWTSKILQPLGLHLPLKTTRISVCYWKENIPGQFSADKFPVLLDRGRTETGYDVYLLPSVELPGYAKVCLHHGPEIDPDEQDSVDDSWIIETMKKYISNNLPGLNVYPKVVESCIYTSTPDEDFILDRHPKWRNIVVGAGFSGRGFKLSPLVGKLICQLVTEKTPSCDLRYFRINRFPEASAKL